MRADPKLALTAAIALLLVVHPTLAKESREVQLENGKELATRQCSGCHAIGISGESPRADAPVFRHVLSLYHHKTLETELIEGIQVGHPDMPKFWLNPAAVSDLIVYLKSIQTRPERKRRP